MCVVRAVGGDCADIWEIISGGDELTRKIYISDGTVSLVEYIPAEDDPAGFENWQDEETKSGYNYILSDTFDEYSKREIKQRFFAAVMLNGVGVIGAVGLSPDGSPPDLAIWIYKDYRGKGYGTRAFALGVRYCFETLKLEKIYAGCYPHNHASRKMIEKCGFLPHPSGNVHEKHYLAGEPLIQYDFVLYNPDLSDIAAKIIAGVSAGKPLTEIYIQTDVDKKQFYKKVFELIDDCRIPNVLKCRCGHDCSRCKIFHSTISDDEKLLNESVEFYKALFKTEYAPGQMRCYSGRSDEIMTGCRDCPFVKCCEKHSADSCSDCAEYPCAMIADYEKKYVNRYNQIQQSDWKPKI